MKSPTLIDRALLDRVSEAARASPRRRKNYNFHPTEAHASSRLLNAIEPDSYVRPHRHLESTKDETLIAVRGRLGVVFFDDAGNVTGHAVISPEGEAIGANIPDGVYHTVLALEPGSIFFEAKAGPYRPLTEEEKAPWAPAEGAPEAREFLERMRKIIGA